MEMTEVGKIEKHDIKTITKDNEGNIYVCKDFEKFSKAETLQQSKQQIRRIICETIFTENGIIEFYAFKQKETVEMLKEKFFEEDLDAKLVSLVKLGQGADMADQSILMNIDRVLRYEEITDKIGAYGIPAGFWTAIAVKNFYKAE